MRATAELRRTTGAALCLDCGKCTSACPLAALGRFSARLVVQQGLEGVGGRGRLVQRCLTCGACETHCPEGVRITDFVRGLREGIPDGERSPCPHAGVFQTLARVQAGLDSPERDLSWIDADLRVAEEGEVALFVGCAPLFDGYFEADLGVRTLDAARGAIRALNHLGIEPVVAADERCCGHDLLWAGDRASFRQLAAGNVRALQARGVRHVLTACAECARTLRLDYRTAVPDFAPQVEHVTEYLARRLDDGALRFRANGAGRVTFHDPCRLGRHLGVIDAPRQVLDALPGTETVEMELSGRDAACCGTSGFQHCDADSRALQTRRLDAARATGADTLVTACPKCLVHFSCAQAEDRRRGERKPQMRILDFTALAADRLATDDERCETTPASGGSNPPAGSGQITGDAS